MEPHIIPQFTLPNALAAALIAVVYIVIFSMVKEPNRQKINAIILAGAGAAYLRGGFGIGEFVFCGFMTFIAFKDLSNYTFIGIGWLQHDQTALIPELQTTCATDFVARNPTSG